MRFGRVLMTACIIVFLCGATACQDQGPMGEVGEKIDDKVEEASDKLSGKEGVFEKLGDKLDEAASDAKEKIEEAEQRADDL